MPRKSSPSPLGTALTLLRTLQGWPQNELAAALGCGPPLVCDYEAGRKPLSRKRMEEILAVLGMPSELLDLTLGYIHRARSVTFPEGSVASGNERMEATIAGATATFEAFVRSFLMLEPARRAEEERYKARGLWEKMKPLSPARRRALVEGSEDYRSWALCELICERSLEAAADRADRALDLAGLAVRIAELAPGSGGWRKRLKGYALAHLGNARRVGGDLPAAEEAFGRARSLWAADTPLDCPRLDEVRMLDLEASLRRNQRRLGEALILIDQALALAVESERTKLLVNRANVLTQAGDLEGAIDSLQSVISLARTETEPRLVCVVLFNLANNLLQAGRQSEADALLPQLRKLAARLNNELDSLRLLWLEARVAAGLGRREEAMAALVRVREQLISQRIAYDMGLVSLELASFYLEEKRRAEVRILARQMLWVFKAQGIHREALAALRLFCEAAEHEDLTIELVRRLVSYLHSARHDPGLRFEADGFNTVS